MPVIARRVLRGVAIVVALAAAVVAGYAAYLELTYYRIEDGVALEARGAEAAGEPVPVGEELTAVTYNVGFGAYTPEFTFFMDTGAMADGTPTAGERGTAVSRESVEEATAGSVGAVVGLGDGEGPDFVLLQEVDVDSDRSHHVDQRAAFEEALPGHASYFASNFHSAFLAYPIPDFHGRVDAGLLTLSSREASEAVRRSYPIDESFPAKYFDLDRCFAVMRYPTSDGRELVVVNSHMSAYDEGGAVRAAQLEVMCDFLSREAAAGNYVVCGGDWNHALFGSEDLYPSGQLVPGWVQTISDEDLPEGFSFVRPANLEEVATCRGCDIPYEPGVTYTVTVDGFLVSDNVRAEAENVDLGFAFSDHQPVLLSFELVGEA